MWGHFFKCLEKMFLFYPQLPESTPNISLKCVFGINVDVSVKFGFFAIYISSDHTVNDKMQFCRDKALKTVN